MTLIVGIKCEDGVVVAADSTATLGTLGMKTVEQNLAKLEIREGKVIMGFSGPVGLAQLQIASLEKLWERILGAKTSTEAARQLIEKAMWSQTEPAIERGKTIAQLVGPQAASIEALSTALIAFPKQNEGVLLEFTPQCSSEEIREALPFTSIGSGKLFADPFLFFLKKTLWDNNCPRTTGQGILAALWTVEHVIECNAGLGVGGKAQVAVLKESQNDWKAELLREEELDEHRQNIQGAEKALADYFRLDN